MRVLVVGGGGREHALVWKIAQSSLVTKIYCAPGNAGIAQLAECLPISPTDIQLLTAFAEANDIGLTVVGPEAPLIAGIVDAFEAKGLPIFGPSADPAKIEGSKAFAKDLMKSAGIPTAEFWTCESLPEARECLRIFYSTHDSSTGIVIKADGLAAGKGVTVADNEAEARSAVDRIMVDRMFGSAGDRVVIEERLYGPEASIMAITDGTSIVPLLPSQDHKRAYDGDLGPNTGGMGAYAPVPVVPPDTARFAVERILRPAIDAIRDLGIPYRGALYAGIIVTADGPKCIEFNCRLGDPETQAILPLLDSDLVAILLAVSDCSLDSVEAAWKRQSAVTVVAASEGYPLSDRTGVPILGLEIAQNEPGCLVFHAGTRREGEEIVTAGGRVLSVTGVGASLSDAIATTYRGMSHIRFDGMFFRSDIGSRASATMADGSSRRI